MSTFDEDYVCACLSNALFQSEARRARVYCERKKAVQIQLHDKRRARLGNLVGTLNPVARAVNTLASGGSTAAAMCRDHLAATKEPVCCASGGLNMVSAALEVAVAHASGGSSGSTSHVDPNMGLAVLSSRMVEADKRAAALLSGAEQNLQALVGLSKLHVGWLSFSPAVYPGWSSLWYFCNAG